MPHTPGKKEAGRARVLASAGRGFRALGYGGLGVDGLAKDAGVTSGAFYAHFPSKAAAFRAAVAAGLDDLRGGVERLRSSLGAGWRAAFVDFYLTERRTCDLGESCALQSLTGEVARAGPEARAEYATHLRGVIDAAAPGMPGETDAQRRAAAIAMLAVLSGGVSMCRAVGDPELAEEIAEAVRAAAAALERAEARPVDFPPPPLVPRPNPL